MIIVNKAYLITYWGQSANREKLVFYKKFLKLKNLYSLIRLSIPLFTYSATLNLEILKDIIRFLVFKDYNTKII